MCRYQHDCLETPSAAVTEVLFHQGFGNMLMANQFSGLKVVFVPVLSSLLPPPNPC